MCGLIIGCIGSQATCVVKSRHCYVKVMSSFNIVSQGTQELLEVYFKIKMWNLMVSKTKNPL